MTTALWYTPSGRSINRPRAPSPDESDDDTPVKKDSAARPQFRTDGGRLVLGGGGIVPDVEVATRMAVAADKALQTSLGAKVPRFRDALLEYALSLKTSHAVTDPGFEVTPAMRDELYRRMQSKGITVSRAVYDTAGALVSRALGSQVARYVFGPRAEFERGLRDDPAMARAGMLLQGVRTQKELLARVAAVGVK